MNDPQIGDVRLGDGVSAFPGFHGADGPEAVEGDFLAHFGINEQPFGVTPDPRFLYLGPKHKQALAALNYGTESNRGFLTLIARPGMGKTSLIFQYLEGLRGKARTVFLFQTNGNSHDLMRYVLNDLGLESRGKDIPEMHSILNKVMMEEMQLGRRFVLVIDEAQNLTDRVLESVRLLSNFETPWKKLMQIVLAGQPQLAERLANPSMAQLRQRVSLSIRIDPFTREEVNEYVDHRLWVAGYKGPPLFTSGARELLSEFSEGVPREINNICFCAMSLCWATKQKMVDRQIMRDIMADLNLGPIRSETITQPKSDEDLKPSAPIILREPVLTFSETPSRSRLRTAAAAGLAFCILGWAGFHSDFGKRFGARLYGEAFPGKLNALDNLTPGSPAPPSASGPKADSPNLDSNASAIEKKVANATQPDRLSSKSIRGSD
jgi:type II secretory pathway predicted ATPase ExeA